MAIQEVEAKNQSISALEKAVMGDLSKFTPQERLVYLNKVCESLGLNPLTKPFEYITLNGKLTLYARKDATEQLRKIHNVSFGESSEKVIEGVLIVKAIASLPDGRTDSDIGAVTISGLKGDALANAYMKAHTKAKRRVTLSICGLGMLDETELETIPAATKNITVTHTPKVISISKDKLLADYEEKISAAMDIDDLKSIWSQIVAEIREKHPSSEMEAAVHNMTNKRKTILETIDVETGEEINQDIKM